MKKQSHKDKLDEHLGMKEGKESTKKQSMKDRRHESEGMTHHKKMQHHLKEAKKHADGMMKAKKSGY